MYQENYTPVSALAVVSLAAGSCSLLGFLLLPVSIVGTVALITGILALFDIRKYCFKGRCLAVAGITLSLIGLLIPPLWVYYAIQLEALPGHSRIDFGQLVRSEPSEFDRLVGEPICLTGFAWSERERASTQFKFSPDRPTGSFGEEPDHWIVVKLPDKWTWNDARLVVSGTLVRIDHPFREHDQPQYVLKAKAVRPAASRVSLLPVSGSGGGC